MGSWMKILVTGGIKSGKSFFAEKNKKKLTELKMHEINRIEPKLNEDVYKIFDLKHSINSKTSYGGTSFENIKKMIRSYKKN